jgi:protein gp37
MTSIEWTDTTWNPVRGCSKVSPGCTNCYAERTAARQAHSGYEGLVRIGEGSPRWTGEVRLVPEKLDDPLSWRKPRRVFVNSMSDLFHEKLTNEEIAAVFASMALAPDQTFQVLTKRAKRMHAWFRWAASEWETIDSPAAIAFAKENGHGPNSNIVLKHAQGGRVLAHLEQWGDDFAAPWPLPNVHVGVSVENQAAADERIPLLRETPAAVRFLSVEPLLGPVALDAIDVSWEDRIRTLDALNGVVMRGEVGTAAEHVEEDGLDRIDWVIVGGESGPGARPCDVAWIRSVVEQCKAAGVPCFVKQLGARPVVGTFDSAAALRDPNHVLALRDRKGGDMAEWPADLRVRQFPEARR